MSFQFDEHLTIDIVQAMLPTNKQVEEWYPILFDILPRYAISTDNRVAAFMAQCAYESLDFTVLEENLNYSADALLRVFGKYFDQQTAPRAARKPEVIANTVYANRMGNGDYSSGDGWNYRGRGIIQLTGKTNYSLASNEIYSTDVLVQYPWVLSEKFEVAVEVACWYWFRNDLSIYADQDDIDTITYRINGGYHGKDQREANYERNKQLLIA
jgi:putative chitinase